jgi:hypothetical protein
VEQTIHHRSATSSMYIPPCDSPVCETNCARKYSYRFQVLYGKWMRDVNDFCRSSDEQDSAAETQVHRVSSSPTHSSLNTTPRVSRAATHLRKDTERDVLDIHIQNDNHNFDIIVGTKQMFARHAFHTCTRSHILLPRKAYSASGIHLATQSILTNFRRSLGVLHPHTITDERDMTPTFLQDLSPTCSIALRFPT